MIDDQGPSPDSAKRTLSEISHLFLSDVRDRQTGGTSRPQRIPPGQRPATPLTPPASPAPDPKNASTSSGQAPSTGSGQALGADWAEPEAAPVPPLTAVIAAHLGPTQGQRVRQYARQLAIQMGRIGLIEIDASDVRVSCFEPAPDADPTDGPRFDDAAFPEPDVVDPRGLAEALEELNWDVKQWLLAPMSLRGEHIRFLLGDVRHWALLSTCDHDGVVSSYRAIKGLCDAVHDTRPVLTLSVLDAAGEPDVARVLAKLSGVCQQFLNWPVEPGYAIVPTKGVGEDSALFFHPANAETDLPWPVLSDLIARANGEGTRSRVKHDPPARQAAVEAEAQPRPIEQPGEPMMSIPRRSVPVATFTPVSRNSSDNSAATSDGPPARGASTTPIHVEFNDSVSPAEESVMNEQPSPARQPVRSTTVAAPATGAPARPPASEVLDISADGAVDSILAAVVSRPGSALVECPVRTPMCPSSRLTIDRDRRMILLAVAREGLADLRSIGQGYRWLIENRALIGMAVPQLAIDARQFPRLRLLVDQADASAEVLQPMLESGHVTVETYRRVRWGDRSGLLLDAA